MSRHQSTRNIPFAASAVKAGVLALTALLVGSLAVPASAQKPVFPQVAPEQGFTIATNAHTPMVLKTEPDAACDLHASGVNDPAHTLKVYANGEGYVKVHVTAKQGPQDVRVQLDCTTADAVTVHPLHLRTGSSPTADMPAPDAVIPTPKDAKVLPALTADAAKQLSDDDIMNLGYPPRPDPSAAPDQYDQWLSLVASPLTIIPPHSVSRKERSHVPQSAVAASQGDVAGTSAAGSPNWSGYVMQGPSHSFMGVTGLWNVPTIGTYEPGNSTVSSFWVGLDGWG
jgi:hypothetical protein